jgi:hypothetical protein
VIEQMGLHNRIQWLGLDNVMEQMGLHKRIQWLGLDNVMEQMGLMYDWKSR